MRIAYVIITCEKYVNTRIKWQQATWLSAVNPADVYYLGHKMDPDNRMFHWFAGDDHLSQSQKIIDFFCNMYLDSYDFIIICDDDTYVFHDRMKMMLIGYDPNALVCFGHVHTPNDFNFYYSGAGIVLSRAVYKELYALVRLDPKIVHHCADVSIGIWLIRLKNIIPGMVLIHHMQLHLDYYDPASDVLTHAITFHHVKTEKQFQDLHLHHYISKVIN